MIICDTKNHLLREANMITKKVTTVCGLVGVRGKDLEGVAPTA